jgi:hypothetical protein
MCYSPEASIGTFFFVSMVALYLWSRNHPLDRPIALIFLVVVLMQLLEWGIWVSLDSPERLQILTKAIPIVLLLQPLFFMLIHWIWNSGWGAFYRESFLLLLILFPFALNRIYSELKGVVRVGESGNLEWPRGAYNWPPWINTMYWFFLIYGFGSLKNIPLSLAMVGGATLSYHMYQRSNPDVWPSIWCHIVNSLSVLAILLN